MIIELNHRALINKKVEGFIIGVSKLSSDCYQEYELDEAITLIDEIHHINKDTKVYIDCTNLFFDEDFPLLKESLDKLQNADYFLYEDLGLKELIPEEKRIYYSITYLTNKEDLAICLENNKAALISPSLALDELKAFNDFKERTFLIAFGTWKIFYSRRQLLKNHFQYHHLPLEEASYKIIEETRNDAYPIIERSGTKIYLNDYFALDLELRDLSNNLILKLFDLDYQVSSRIIDLYQKALVDQDYEALKKGLNDLNLKLHKGLLYEDSLLIKKGGNTR